MKMVETQRRRRRRGRCEPVMLVLEPPGLWGGSSLNSQARAETLLFIITAVLLLKVQNLQDLQDLQVQ